jgi:carbamoyl-phosphate synthase large subunit
MAHIATQLMLGTCLSDLDLRAQTPPYYGVKEAVLPFTMFPEVDPVLGPEMRSTGEVLGLDRTFGLAFFKAQEAAQQSLPLEGTVLISVSDREKPLALEAARAFFELGFTIMATEGTQRFLTDHGIRCEFIKKQHEGRPNIADGITNGEIHLVVNTPVGKLSQYDDSYLRKAAIKHKIPYITTMSAALAAATGIAERRIESTQVRSLQDYHKSLPDLGGSS